MSTSKKGAILTAVVSLAAMGAIGATFLANASPYVDVAGALSSHGDNLHLAGNIVKPTLHSDFAARKIDFTVQDAKGKTLPVEYTGEAISNIGEADRVVAVGGMENGVFHSTKLLIKCPSKYGDGKTSAPATSYAPTASGTDGQVVNSAYSHEVPARKGI